MTPEERRSTILAMLAQNTSVQVAQLAEAFGTSRVTARGDLDALAALGKLRRTHGGAISLSKTLTVSTQDRRVNVNVEAKRAIARTAAGFVSDGEAVLVDSGTTALEFVRVLDRRSGITVITADMTIANFIDESLPAVDAILLGGSLRKGHRYLYGPLATRSLEILHADKAFLCPTALVPGFGLMTNYEQMAEVKASMMGAARQRIVLLDSSKVNGKGLFRFGSLTDIDAVVMDRDPSGIVAAELDAIDGDAHRPRLIIARP